MTNAGFLEAKLFTDFTNYILQVCCLSDGRETTSVCALFATGSY
ncbi:unnamed protein product [Plutella xylostella]|uniref:(diamondback moth) hypothetical protein n=1 Tax=Plutella xylostella TaxID=51655 RepID=A0A8S4DE12_PLUXY|nr:unnamed protein product [Plutella xylostella]